MAKRNFASGDDEDSFDQEARFEVGEPTRKRTAAEVAAMFTGGGW